MPMSEIKQSIPETPPRFQTIVADELQPNIIASRFQQIRKRLERPMVVVDDGHHNLVDSAMSLLPPALERDVQLPGHSNKIGE